MSSQQKKINSVLIALCAVSSILAIYFGVKSQNLSKQLNNQNTSLKTENIVQNGSKIHKIDSLLFQKDYRYAYEISKELKQTQNFANDSTFLLRYNLVSEIVKSKKLGDSDSNASNIYSSYGANTSNEVLLNKLDSVSQKLNRAEQNLTNGGNTAIITKAVKTSEYLTFKTTKGTDLHYIGAIKDHRANGYGVALLETGSRYEGDWKNNERHGYGKFIWNDGDSYEGAYGNDMRNGMGTYKWKNGEKYIGEWKDDKRNGRGEFFNKKGKLKTSGTWENDELVEQDVKDKKHKLSLTKR